MRSVPEAQLTGRLFGIAGCNLGDAKTAGSEDMTLVVGRRFSGFIKGKLTTEGLAKSAKTWPSQGFSVTGSSRFSAAGWVLPAPVL